MQDYETRKIARSEGRRYCDAAVLKYQMERMPEEIRLRHGGIGSHQLTIYDELATNIPGFLPSTAVEGGLHALPYSLKSTQVCHYSIHSLGSLLLQLLFLCHSSLGDSCSENGLNSSVRQSQSCSDFCHL